MQIVLILIVKVICKCQSIQILSEHCYDLILHTFIFCTFLRIYRINECPMTSSFRIRVKNISILKCTRVQKACKLPFTLILNTQYTKDLLLAYEIFREEISYFIFKIKEIWKAINGIF